MYKSEEQLKTDMLSRIKNTVDKSENSFIHDAIAPASIELANFYTQLEYVKGKLDVENLEALELETIINQRTGIKRKLATKATVNVTIRGVVDAKVAKGTLVSADGVIFEVQEDAMIGADGEVEVLVESQSEGSVGNVGANTIVNFPVSVAGLNSVTNIKAASNGYDDETDNELRARYYRHIRIPATSGNIHHYLSWAREVVGVGDAKVIPLWDGDNTVKVIIIDNNQLPADEDLVEKVQNYIDPGITGKGEGEAPIGAFCTVVSATSKLINVNFNLSKDVTNTLEEIEEFIKESISNYLKEIAFTGKVISYAKIGSAILDSKGVLDYSNLIVNGGNDNIAVADTEVATLGTVVINE